MFFFFGFSLQRRKSKKEVMDEIIMKSKLGKVGILLFSLLSFSWELSIYSC